jgi:hypothetical protein
MRQEVQQLVVPEPFRAGKKRPSLALGCLVKLIGSFALYIPRAGHRGQMRLQAGSLRRCRDGVFGNTVGEYSNPVTANQAFHKLLARAGLPLIRLHDVRHSAATPLIIGIDV